MDENPVIEALKSGREINKIWIAEGSQGGSYGANYAVSKRNGVLVQFVPKKKIDQMVDGNHQGVVAQVAAYQYAELDDLFNLAEKRNEGPFFLTVR